MKNKKRITYVAIAILVMCNIFLLYSIRKVQAESSSSIAALYPYAQKFTVLQANISTNIKYSARIIEVIEMFDKNNQPIKISSLFSDNGEPLFILRISDRYCNSCVKYFVNLFKNNKLNNDIQFIYLTGFQNKNRVIYEAKEFEIDETDFYNVPFLNVPIDNAGYPYLIVVGKDLKFEYCYFPTKDHDDIDIENLNMIIECYAKKYK